MSPSIVRSLLGVLIAVVIVTANAETPWKRFVNHAGWQIGYPGDWKPTGCAACEDLTAADNTVVMFQSPGYRGHVQVEKLADKPAGVTDRHWLWRFKATNSRDADVLEVQPLTLNGMAALSVIYSAPSSPVAGKGEQHQSIYITHAGASYAVIVFSPRRIRITDPIVPVRQLDIYPIYRRMLLSFRIGGH